MNNLQLTKLTCVLFAMFLFSFTAISQEEEKGDLFLVDIEYVSPDNYDEYEQWGKDFKKLADETKFKNFYVASNSQAFFYVWRLDGDIASIDAHGEAWGKWSDANPGVDEMNEKYKHTIEYRKRELWRIDMKHSYRPEGYEPSMDNTYTRQFFGYVKTGQGKAVAELLEEYAAEWKAKGISTPYTVYWNVFGLEQNCMLVVSSYKDRAAWVADGDEVNEKVGKDKIDAWNKRWNEIMRKMEVKESYPRYDLSHFNPPETASSDAASDSDKD